ncbi:hypothetical protein NP493_1314g00029 [Ridgeia piscesae]|uniref:protein-tyrosine-phosphatase n=1 Tax=Ridgeia piscesae TaxID=27915 RepID=A0AAD9K7M0_RIDPI|nr:hypothetical protein NP493_1314g00029 [Ridgeia piscesae]
MRKIRQLHFTAWPDKGTPDYAYPLLAFHRKVRSFDPERRGPLLQAAAEGAVDVFECVNLLRTQRISMVQTLDQYLYVYQAFIQSSEVTFVPCSQLKDAFDELSRDKKLSKQFQSRPASCGYTVISAFRDLGLSDLGLFR